MSLAKLYICVLLCLFLTPVLVGATSVSLRFDQVFLEHPPTTIYFAGNFDLESGEMVADWNGYRRYALFDDGTHGDEVANDGIWSRTLDIQPNPNYSYEWAVDLDSEPGNGWLGTGPAIRVLEGETLIVDFFKTPIESKMTREQIEAEFNVKLSDYSKPIPIENGGAYLFVFRTQGVDRAFLAGSFNNFGDNENGSIKDGRYAMYPIGDGLWVKRLELKPSTIRYKFVTKKGDDFAWHSDPHVPERDKDGNSIVDLRRLIPGKYVTSIPGRKLVNDIEKAPELDSSLGVFENIELKHVWVRPDEDHELQVIVQTNQSVSLEWRTTRDLVNWTEWESLQLDQPSTTTLTFPAGGIEAPVVADFRLMSESASADRAFVVMPVATDYFDDLRYGFYANWDSVDHNYDAKTDMLADLLINAIEYYDYFPAHGIYAPTEEVYEFEPFFGKKIHALDVQSKIESGHRRNIMAIAYVAAYAASKSVYEKYPFPITDSEGNVRVFNGSVVLEKDVDARGDKKWFWLMAIARDTPWYEYIMEEFRRTLTDEPGDLVSFDGFEVDSYGHAESERYFSDGSIHSGRPLADVIADFIADVQELSHAVKETAAVSFNCVCEFGISRMYDITDFIFIENWAGCKAGIEDTVDICYNHRAARNQRVILKIYPPDAGFTDPPIWPEDHLRLMMGLSMAGGGSLMVAGEPNEKTNEMHALNSLYYPDNVAIPNPQRRIIKNYNTVDAMLYGYNHGRMVSNYETSLYVPGCVTRGFINDAGDITVTILNSGEAISWNTPRGTVTPVIDQEVAINIPATFNASEVIYLSPDREEYMCPTTLDYENVEGYVRTLIPEVHTFGAITIKRR